LKLHLAWLEGQPVSLTCATRRATGLAIDAEESATVSMGSPMSSLCCVTFYAPRRLKSRQHWATRWRSISWAGSIP